MTVRKKRGRYVQWIKKTCKQCKKVFEVKPSKSDTKFCGHECYVADGRKRWVVKTCLECRKEFRSIKSAERSLCSKTCQNVYQKGRYKARTVVRNCLKCERAFRSRGRYNKVCNRCKEVYGGYVPDHPTHFTTAITYKSQVYT